jgi:hypothetical protein
LKKSVLWWRVGFGKDSGRGRIVLENTVLWRRDGLGKDGLVVEGWSLKRWSCRGRHSLGQDGLVEEGRSWKRRSYGGGTVLEETVL